MKKEKRALVAMIAEPVLEQQQHLAQLLERDGVFRVGYMTHDGLDCLRQAALAQPDLLVVNAILDQIDGLELLRRVKELPGSKTKCLFLTTHGDYLLQHAIANGADHCILLPCPDEILAQRARDLVLPPKRVITDKEIDAHTVQLLRVIGAPENIKGYRYTLDAVRILVRDPDLVMRRAVTTELYCGIAKLHGLRDDKRVERTLRTLTDHIFNKHSLDVLSQYFNPVDIQRSHVTNTVFLSTLAREVASRIQEAHDQGLSAMVN